MTPTSVVAYIVLFLAVGAMFPLGSLLLGRLVRAQAPSAEKLQAYECGETAVGSSFVQFDLRFYVIALVFLIFDVEVAFFFPWATVFGKSTQLMGLSAAAASASPNDPSLVDDAMAVKYRELQGGAVVPAEVAASRPDNAVIAEDAQCLALASMADLAVFFAVLLVGFAYVWYRGDLTWVRAIGTAEASQRAAEPAPIPAEAGS